LPGFEGMKVEDAPARTKLRVLFVEDDPADVDLASCALQRSGIDPEYDVADSAESFTAHVQKSTYDVVLADYNLPSWNGMATVEILQREGLDIPVVLVSGALGELVPSSASSRAQPITY
jgi:DNA-binding NtrC family response regulator